ncbi:integral membrane protein S linking to the trans Golgi network-domain-containing protein [Cristinia sonorae]|uniref:Integral membrane protein S linking to the trans Golgi network-domain-containing protein n=1 Tax=Cristinia sonorae TaxID=1940300 RepID=A0A8K0UJ50_9AGAR|nr:integral membrane protein S linking to the trans Golgi network-domain-containing protein [Cristinia sonorae]
MVMDWRYLAGQPTIPSRPGEDPWLALRIIWSGGKQIASDSNYWSGRMDPLRGWIIAACWMATSVADVYYLYFLVRRPRMILDFSLTLLFNHMVLTTYYAAALPTSWFFWATMVASTAVMVIAAEQLCVRREMSEGLTVVTSDDAADEMEMGDLLRRD